jgi:hypothetical protein
MGRERRWREELPDDCKDEAEEERGQHRALEQSYLYKIKLVTAKTMTSQLQEIDFKHLK